MRINICKKKHKNNWKLASISARFYMFLFFFIYFDSSSMKISYMSTYNWTNDLQYVCIYKYIKFASCVSFLYFSIAFHIILKIASRVSFFFANSLTSSVIVYIFIYIYYLLLTIEHENTHKSSRHKEIYEILEIWRQFPFCDTSKNWIFTILKVMTGVSVLTRMHIVRK